uniref:Ubiquitin-like protease family profile domain-containing protein n=1 Tax=Oryza nivara TaxID=4536 RepID=A0A0E0HPI5_ORYNI
MEGTSQRKKKRGTLVCFPYNMYDELTFQLSPRQKEAIEDSGFGNLLKINKIYIDRNLCNAITRSYDKEKKAFTINGTFVMMTLDDVDCLLGLPSKGEEIFEAPKINKPELFNLYDNHFIQRLILFLVGSFICPTTQRYVCSEYLNLVDDVEKNEATKLVKSNPESTNIDYLMYKCLQIWYWIVNDIRGTIDCKEISGKKEQTKDSETHSNQNIQCTSDEEDSNQCNQSSKRLTGPTGRTYKSTNRTDFCYESRVYIEKEDLTKKNIHKSPSKNALREKGIRGDGNAFLEQAIKTCLLNVEGAHVESNNPRDKQWIRDMAREYLPFDMIFLPINIKETHWYLAVLNTKRHEMQILDSLAKPVSEY